MNRIHFGVMPRFYYEPEINGWKNPTEEHEFDMHIRVPGQVTGKVDILREALPQLPDIELHAIVSGSWACWGPADQASEGDMSLHVVIEIGEVYETLPQAYMETFHDDLFTDLEGRLSRESRLLDYAVITEPDWSVIRGIVLFRSRPFSVAYATGPRML